MIKLPQVVKIKWNGNIRKYYESKGYTYTHHLGEFEVNVLDLTPSASVIVDVECDFCHTLNQMPYRNYFQLRGNQYCCPNCLKHMKKQRDENGNLQFIEIPYRNKEWLYNEYIIKNRNAKDIAEECNINVRTLREWISILDIEKYNTIEEKLPSEILYNLYFVQHLTSSQIGEMYNVSDGTIISLIKKYGYKIPTRSELINIYYNEKNGYEKVRKTQSTMENRIKSSCRQRGISIEEFKGFSTNEQHMARNNTFYKEWVINVFKRDNYTCQCCGKRGGNLNAHHLYNFSEYEELRYEVSNGITLCEKCHLIKYPNSFHSIYGERNNTPEQITEYIKMKKKGSCLIASIFM